MAGDSDRDLEALLAEIIQYHDEHGELPRLEAISPQHPDIADQLLAAAQQYLALDSSLDDGAQSDDTGAPPVIAGFQTIEKIGTGGMGEVYKLRDLTLDRIVAGKIIRRRPGNRAGADFKREAQSLALFSDPHIVRIFEYRMDADPGVIIME